MTIAGAVEGSLDEVVLQRLVEQAGAELWPVHGKKGKAYLLENLRGFNNAAKVSPWIVLVDLDRDADCVPPFREDWLPHPTPKLCFRVAVRAIEAWLFADPERLAKFLRVKVSRIPNNPEEVTFPKRSMVELAGQSRRRDIRQDMVPRPGSGRSEGPAYTSRLIEFVIDVSGGWRPEVAALSSDSMKRCIRCLEGLVSKD